MYTTNQRDQVQTANKKAVAKYCEKNKKKREDMTEWDGLRVFWAETAWGAIYRCIICHKTRFRN